jgi:DNA-binding PadR family transcriptional regulator
MDDPTPPAPSGQATGGLNPTAASLLGFLHARPLSGYDLLRIVQGSIGYFWNVTRSHLYREMHSLEERGLVEAGAVAGPRDRRPFTLTPAGRAAFAAWITEEPGEELIRFPLMITVFFGDHLPDARLDEMVSARRRQHAERLAEYRRIERRLVAAGDRHRLATLRFGISYEEAALRWFDARPWAPPGE